MVPIPPLPAAPYTILIFVYYVPVLYENLCLNDQHSARVLYSKYQQPPPDTHTYAHLWHTYHQHLVSITVRTQAEFPALPPPVFQYAQVIAKIPANNTTMTALSAPLSPTISIFEARSVSQAKRLHSLSSSLVLNTSDDGTYNLEDTLTQILATMVASFASLQQEITTLRTKVTTLTTTNQAQAKEIQSLATIIQYLSIRTQARYPTSPPSNNRPNLQTPRQLPVPTETTHSYLQQEITLLQGNSTPTPPDTTPAPTS